MARALAWKAKGLHVLHQETLFHLYFIVVYNLLGKNSGHKICLYTTSFLELASDTGTVI